MINALHPRRSFVLTVLAIGVLTATGCLFSPEKKSDPPTDPGGTYLAPTSPENVLHNLEEAYRNREIQRYTALIADDYVFEASEADLEVDFDYLNYDQEIETHENMFRNVDNITITLDHNGAVPSDRAAYPPEDGYMKILVPAVRIDVLSRIADETSGELITFRVNGDPAVFIFEPDFTKTPTEYKVVYQQDLFTGRLAADHLAQR